MSIQQKLTPSVLLFSDFAGWVILPDFDEVRLDPVVEVNERHLIFGTP